MLYKCIYLLTVHHVPVLLLIYDRCSNIITSHHDNKRTSVTAWRTARCNMTCCHWKKLFIFNCRFVFGRHARLLHIWFQQALIRLHLNAAGYINNQTEQRNILFDFWNEERSATLFCQSSYETHLVSDRQLWWSPQVPQHAARHTCQSE